jgi:hypothetical protein
LIDTTHHFTESRSAMISEMKLLLGFADPFERAYHWIDEVKSTKRERLNGATGHVTTKIV